MSLIIDRRYDISSRRLGGGAFGDVWLGTDLDEQHEIAAKIAAVPSGRVNSQEIENAFRREEAALQRIAHPNVIRLRACGMHEERRYLILDFIAGQSLWSIFRQQQVSPTMGAMRKARILLDLARALAETHNCGFVHLDVKPENVLVASDDRAFLIDFGSAMPALQARSRDAGIETHAYCAPEQIQGSRWAVAGAGLSPRTDVFAFGIVAWELLSLRRPFGDENAVQLQRIAHENPDGNLLDLAPGCPPDLAALIGVCLNKNPQSRYGSMAQVAERLENIAAVLASRTLYAEGQIEAAIQKAEEAVGASPDLQEARDMVFAYRKELAAALVARGDGERARECLQRARDHCWGTPERLAELRQLEAEIGTSIFNHGRIAQLVMRAKRDRASGNHLAADQYIAMAAAIDPLHPLLENLLPVSPDGNNPSGPGGARGGSTDRNLKSSGAEPVRNSPRTAAGAEHVPPEWTGRNTTARTPRPADPVKTVPAPDPQPIPPTRPGKTSSGTRVFRPRQGLVIAIAGPLLLLLAWRVWPGRIPDRSPVPPPQILRHLPLDGIPVVTIRSVKSKRDGTRYLRVDTPTPTSLDVPPGWYEVVWVDSARKEHSDEIFVSPDHEPDRVVFRGME